VIVAPHTTRSDLFTAEAIGAGACAIVAYDQQALDTLLRLDGEEEFVLCLAPTGEKVE
jgi:nitroreductase